MFIRFQCLYNVQRIIKLNKFKIYTMCNSDIDVNINIICITYYYIFYSNWINLSHIDVVYIYIYI